MNNLFKPISWSAYLETISVLAIAYYAFIAWKYYRPEIKAVIAKLSGKKPDENELPAALQYTGSAEQSPAITHTSEPDEIAGYEQPQGAIHNLTHSLKASIDFASEEPYAPDALITKIKKILNDYPDIAATPQREEINALIVRECEKTGTALLSESEVDMWWSA